MSIISNSYWFVVEIDAALREDLSLSIKLWSSSLSLSLYYCISLIVLVSISLRDYSIIHAHLIISCRHFALAYLCYFHVLMLTIFPSPGPQNHSLRPAYMVGPMLVDMGLDLSFPNFIPFSKESPTQTRSKSKFIPSASTREAKPKSERTTSGLHLIIWSNINAFLD